MHKLHIHIYIHFKQPVKVMCVIIFPCISWNFWTCTRL